MLQLNPDWKTFNQYIGTEVAISIEYGAPPLRECGSGGAEAVALEAGRRC